MLEEPKVEIPPKNPSKKQQTLHVDVGDLKQPWLDWCEAQGVTSSDALRQVITKLTTSRQDQAANLGRTQPSQTPKKRHKERTDTRDASRVRCEIKLSGSEAQAAQEHAHTAGFSRPKWIVALIRAQLTGNPQLGQTEQELLGESNFQLLTIGRNLNQIAKALNGTPDDRSAYNVQAIEELREAIQRHVAKASAVILANTQRWRIE